MKCKLIAAALFGAVLCPSPALADDTMEIAVVTPTRTPQSPGSTIADTTVITAEDIRKSQAPDVPSLLRGVAGVEVSQPGGLGKPASLFLRGTNSDQVLVLVDGVRINSATTGTTAVDQLSADQIERIEVVRGNVSSVYGSEAIGGVIQIFTRHGHGAPALNASAGVGSQGTRRVSAGIGGAEAGTDFSVQASSFRTDGVSALNPAQVPAANPDRDGYRNNSISANLGHAYSADHRISASLFGSNGNNQYDNAFGLPTDVNTSREQMWKLSIASDDQINETWHSKVQVANGVDQYRDYLNGQPLPGGSLFQTTSNQLAWQNALHLSDANQVLLGAESLRQQVSSDTAFTRTARNENSVFAGYTGRYANNQVQVNLRQDNYSDFGVANTGLLGYGYSFSDAWRATASYSTAFKAPTFDDMYWPFTNFGFGTYQGNPNLQPERSRSFDAGLHYYVSAGQQFDAVYFDNRIHDLIALNAAGTTVVNINQARINGLELSYGGKFGDTGVKAGVTGQNPRDAVTGVQLDKRAKVHSSFGVTQQLGEWQVGGEWLYSGKRPDVGNTQTLAAYNVFNLSAGYAVSKELKMLVRADNLTNKNDSNAYGYNPLGRRIFVSVNYQQ